MPLTEADYREPKFIKIDERYPMSYDEDDKYNEICPRHEAARYRGSEGREGGWKLPGYNPSHNSISIEKINIRSDDMQLRPY